MEELAGLQLSDLSDPQLSALVAFGIAAGTLYCFLGYRTVRFVIGLTGFLLAGAVAAVLAGWISEGNIIAMGISAILGGACGAMALFFLYKTGIFFLGLLGATILAHNLLTPFSDAWVPLAVFGLGLVGGLVALITERPVVTVATAIVGAWMLVMGLGYFVIGTGWLERTMRALSDREESVALLACWSIFAIAGILSQFSMGKAKAKENA